MGLLSNKYFLLGVAALLAASVVFNPLVVLPKMLMYAAITGAVSFGAAKFAIKKIGGFYKTSVTQSQQQSEGNAKQNEVDSAIEKMGNGRDVDDPGVKAVIDKLRDNGLTVTTNWEVAKQVIAMLPEKYSHLREHIDQIRGFVYKGKIFINPDMVDLSIPIHEYAHIWAEAYRQNNPKGWEHVVTLLKAEKDIWEKVKADYPHLENDDEIADEVLATFSGRQGEERLKEFGIECDKPKKTFTALRKALDVFWHGVAKLFNCEFDSAKDIADRVMYDFLKGENPGKYIDDNVASLSDNKPLPHMDDSVNKTSEAMSADDILHREDFYREMILRRLAFTASTYVDGGQRSKAILWNHNPESHIDLMYRLYDSLEKKPDWLSRQQIDGYAASMVTGSRETSMSRAVEAIVARTTDSSAKSFSPEQQEAVRGYLQTLPTDKESQKNGIDSLWKAAEEDVRMKGVFDEWKADAKAELDDLASGIRREAEGGLRR